MLKYLSVAMVAVTTLTSCAKPVTRSPSASREEIRREAMYQEQSVRAAGSNKPANTSYDMADQQAVARLQPVVSNIIREGEKVCRELYPNQNCRYGISLDGRKEARKQINAYADGKEIRITPAMVAFTQSPDELAQVLAHEYAHNILGHVGKNQQNVAVGSIAGMLLEIAAASQGYNAQGQLAGAGQQMGLLSYSSGFEKEADYVGLYIARRAGYDISRAGDFWRRMSREDPRGIYTGTTHPSNAERYVTLNKAYQEITAKERAGQRLMPEFIPQE